ncbi:MAG: phosphopantetheine-binding protein [Desulfotalea sp.]
MSDLKIKLKELFIAELGLEDIELDEWQDDMPLFGEEDGIGLDSLDAVEIVVLIEKHFGVSINNVDEGKTAMASIANLSAFILSEQKND